MSGTLALVGGGEWQAGCTFDAALLDEAGTGEVAVLPTAAAYSRPDRAVATATEHFAGLGAKVREIAVLQRTDALLPEHVDAVRASRFLYLAGGSPMHLVSVLKGSPVWEALVDTWNEGAVLAGSSAGAMVLCDPMVDPRGGAFTVGLGLLSAITVVPHANELSADTRRRTLQLAPTDIAVVTVDEQTALLRAPDGAWRAEGVGTVQVHRNGEERDLTDLAT